MTRDDQIIRALRQHAVWPDEVQAANWAESIIRQLPAPEASIEQSPATTVQPKDAEHGD